ncbi:MAG TPA: hypothetical protein VNC78_00680 [Actinomycetota bacterium]|nr:hypothetical protein [Actinomycetota bacterium]
MKKLHATAAGLAAALLLGACGSPSGTQASPEREATKQVALTRATLENASQAAQRYGQAHLGHFLELSTKDLRKEGLGEVEGISVKVSGGHAGYCIKTLNDALPSIHPWAAATVSSAAREPSPADRCSPAEAPIQNG